MKHLTILLLSLFTFVSSSGFGQKMIHELPIKTNAPDSTWLMLIGNPTAGTLYKMSVDNFRDSVLSIATLGSTLDTTSLSNRINLKLNKTDTASLSNRIDAISEIDTTSLSLRIDRKPKVYNVLDYMASGYVQGTTDATSGIQAAINACIADGGGTVFFPYDTAVYVISGALQTSVSSVNPNCQIYIPNVPLATKMVTIKLMGEAIPSLESESFGDITRNTQGPILQSTITGSGTLPAVIAMPWQTYSGIGNRNYVHVDMENLIVRTNTKSGATDIAGTMSAINFKNVLKASFRNVKVDITSKATEMVEPTNETFGIILPFINNHTCFSTGFMMAEGYKYGFVIQEHFNADYVVAFACVNGIVTDHGHHSANIKAYTVENCVNQILMMGDLNLHIANYNSENASSDWWATEYNVKFVTSASVVGNADNLGFLRTKSVHIDNLAQVTPNVGVENTFLTNDSTNVYIKAINSDDLQETIQYLASAATHNIDLLNGSKAYFTLTANTAVNFINSFYGKEVTLFAAQDGSGDHTLTVEGIGISVDTIANAVTTIKCTHTTNGWICATSSIGVSAGGSSQWMDSGSDIYFPNNVGVGVAPSWDLHVRDNVGSNGAVSAYIENTNAAGEASFVLKTPSAFAALELFGGSFSGAPDKALFTAGSAVTDLGFATLGAGSISFRTNTSTGFSNERLAIASDGTITSTGQFNANHSSAGAGFAIKNTNASGYSGIEYLDNSGALAVFTGYNNGGAGEFRFNNIATSGFITFKIAGTDRFKIRNSGVINISNAPVYADDTAAGVGGLVAGDIYQTSGGVLMIKQ